MENKTLAISRGCIPYIKELRNIAGSVTASILMQQLDYWFDKTNGNQFYKFKASCEKRKYHYVNGEIVATTYRNDIAIPCIYLFSKRQDFKEKYQEMKETLSK